MRIDTKEAPAITRREVEAKLNSVGDYVKMDFLSACLKKNLDFDTRKFVLVRLAAIYESRKMFIEAGKLMRASADINTTFDAKTTEFMKSCELFIKGGNFEEGDVSFTKALALATQKQKEELKAKRKALVKAQAQEYVKQDKRKHAASSYEKLLTLDLSPQEKQEANNALIGLYEKLGKVREFYNLKRNVDAIKSSPSSQAQPRHYMAARNEEAAKKFDKSNPSVDELIGDGLF